MNDIRSLLIQILEPEFGNKYAFVGTVLPGGSGNLIKVQDVLTNKIYDNIRLQATDSANGILLTPSTGSNVLVAMTSDTSGYVAMYSSLDAIQFLDGSFGGLIKIDDLVTQLNAVENKVNDLITYINTHVHPTPGAIPSPLFVGGSLTPTTNNDIENEDITHGAP